MTGITVAIPAYNEASTIGVLLKTLSEDPLIDEIVVVDDCSDDDTAPIVSNAGGKARLIKHSTRSGQTAAWQTALREAKNEVVVFMDADSLPEPGSVCILATAVQSGADLAGGRAQPKSSGTWLPSRFSALLFSTLSEMSHRETQVIGRLFAVRRNWLRDVQLPWTVISNDMWLSLYCRKVAGKFIYCPGAVMRYRAPDNLRDFKSQRIRADLGRKQLNDWGLLDTNDSRLRLGLILRALWVCTIRDPIAAAAWFAVQAVVYTIPWPRIAPPRNGMWQPQASTKTI